MKARNVMVVAKPSSVTTVIKKNVVVDCILIDQSH
jgi:hypothetical protein